MFRHKRTKHCKTVSEKQKAEDGAYFISTALGLIPSTKGHKHKCVYVCIHTYILLYFYVLTLYPVEAGPLYLHVTHQGSWPASFQVILFYCGLHLHCRDTMTTHVGYYRQLLRWVLGTELQILELAWLALLQPNTQPLPWPLHAESFY